MAMIKSALEIALARAKDIKVDEAALEANALKVEGKKAAGRYLEEPALAPLADALGKFAKEKRAAVREGMFEVLAAQIQLPSGESYQEKLEALSAGFSSLAASSGTSSSSWPASSSNTETT